MRRDEETQRCCDESVTIAKCEAETSLLATPSFPWYAVIKTVLQSDPLASLHSKIDTLQTLSLVDSRTRDDVFVFGFSPLARACRPRSAAIIEDVEKWSRIGLGYMTDKDVMTTAARNGLISAASNKSLVVPKVESERRLLRVAVLEYMKWITNCERNKILALLRLDLMEENYTRLHCVK